MKVTDKTPKVSKDTENAAIQKQLEEREAGVTELLDFYAKVERVYVSSLKALEERYDTRASTNS